MFGLTLRRRDPATAVTRKRRNPGAPCISTPPVGVHPELSSCGSGGDGWQAETDSLLVLYQRSDAVTRSRRCLSYELRVDA